MWFYVNVKDEKTGEVTNWGAEMGPPHGLQRRGWRQDTLKIGEEVTVAGSLAKNGAKRMNASKVTLTSTGARPGETLDAASSGSAEKVDLAVRRLVPRRGGTGCCCAGVASMSDGVGQEQGRGAARRRRGVQVGVPQGRGPAPRRGGRGRQAGPPPGPAPRSGRRDACCSAARRRRRRACGCRRRRRSRRSARRAVIPFQPWAKALLDDRGSNQLEPHTRCKPSGFVRQFLTPYGVEFVELPEIQRVYIFDIGGPHTFRDDLHGRPHASGEPQARPTTATRSAGGKATRWSSTPSASTRASGSIAAGSPHTDKLHTLERFTRTDADTIKYESHGRRSGRVHGAVDERVQPALGRRHGALRVRLPAGELRAGAHGRRRKICRSDELNRSVEGSKVQGSTVQRFEVQVLDLSNLSNLSNL